MRKLNSKEEGSLNPKENPESKINLSGTVDAIRAKIAELSETRKPFEMLAGVLQLLKTGPRRLMPLYLATAIVVLSACTPEMINFERKNDGLAVTNESDEILGNSDLNEETLAARKRVKEIIALRAANDNNLEIKVTNEDEKYIHISIYTIDSKEPVEQIEYHKETMEPRYWYRTHSEGEIKSENTEFKKNGLPMSKGIVRTSGTESIAYDIQGFPLYSIPDNNEHALRMLKHDGETFGTLMDERKKNPQTTPEDYLKMLANELDTDERLGLFFQKFLEYQSDISKPDAPKGKVNENDRTEHWQTAHETISRVSGGKMLGDCDDYSFLVREILRRQGKLAHVVVIPGHAICIWLEKNTHGKYIAYALSSGEFSKDEEMGPIIGVPRFKKKEGHNTVKAAINAALKRHNYRINDGKIAIVEIINETRVAFIVPPEVFISEEKYIESTQKTKYFRSQKK